MLSCEFGPAAMTQTVCSGFQKLNPGTAQSWLYHMTLWQMLDKKKQKSWAELTSDTFLVYPNFCERRDLRQIVREKKKKVEWKSKNFTLFTLGCFYF